jgi:hypothetical protein
MNPDVVSVQPQPDFCLLVAFSSGETKRFDVKPYLDYPVYQKLKQGNYFARAHVEHGTVVWNEQTDLSPDSLYLLGQPA